MKRRGKCAGKIAYGYRTHAEAQVIKNFLYQRKTLGIYECPTCLDFHLTGLYDNRTIELKHKCSRLKKTYWQLLPHHREAFIKRVMYLHTIDKEPVQERITTPPNPHSKNRKDKEKKREYKQSIVPIAEQKRIVATLNHEKLLTPQPFWMRIIDIIKKVGI